MIKMTLKTSNDNAFQPAILIIGPPQLTAHAD